MELVINVMEWLASLRQPWHWSVSGVAIALIVFLMSWMGRSFGVSTMFKNLCNIAGAGKQVKFFDYDLKDEYWRFAFVAGTIMGGFIASNYLASPEAVAISEATIQHLQQHWGITYPQGAGMIPESIFNFGNSKGILLAIFGGFFVGFGARYAKGCTSGHAITGLSHLQLQSLLSVIGFFIGGLLMTWLIMPFIFG